MGGQERKPDQDELVRNILIGARTNGYYGDIVRMVGESEKGLGLVTITHQHPTIIARVENNIDPQDSIGRVQSAVALLEQFGILQKSASDLSTITPLARKYWDRFEPQSSSVPVEST